MSEKSSTGYLGKILKDLFLNKMLPPMRETLFDEKVFGHPINRRLQQLIGKAFKLTRFRFIQEKIPDLKPGLSNFSWIPINEDIEGIEEIALPEEILDRLVERAKHRVIVNFCPCRTAMKCQNHPRDIGCLHMGESALSIPEKSRREVGVEAAKAHIREAIKSGLVPIAGKVRADNYFAMIPDEGKLLSLCFCCDCCCMTRFTRVVPHEVMDGMQYPLEGLSLEVTDSCVGCGICASKCYINAIEMKDGCAAHGPKCRICGRCVINCPNNAIKLKYDTHHDINDVVERIGSLVEF